MGKVVGSARSSRHSAARLHHRINISPGFAVGIGLLLCLDPAGLCVPFLVAMTLHESGHAVCLRCCGVPITMLHIGFLGANMETGRRSNRQELLCAAAGPVVNLLTGAALWPIWPQFAVVSFLLATCNLLPVYPLDGGRMVQALLPGLASAISVAVSILLFLAGIACTAVLHWGLWPLLLLGILLGKTAIYRAQEQKLIANRASGLYNNGRSRS